MTNPPARREGAAAAQTAHTASVGAPDGTPPEPDQQRQPHTSGAAAEMEPEPHRADGLELAEFVARGLVGKTRRQRRSSAALRPRGRRQVSSAHPDARDPQLLDTTMAGLVRQQGWVTNLKVHGVFTRWAHLVGDEVAEHATPEAFADGRLTVRTSSTAWATQLRLMAASILKRLNDELGDQTVLRIDVKGPQAPSWSRGPLRVKGRGPRDTYG